MTNMVLEMVAISGRSCQNRIHFLTKCFAFVSFDGINQNNKDENKRKKKTNAYQFG